MKTTQRSGPDRGRFVDFLPMILFVITPVFLIILARIYPGLIRGIFGIGALLAAGFIVYILFYRKENTPLASTAIPTVFGPLVAFGYIKGQCPFDPNQPSLDAALQHGGAELVQLAFFFTALITFGASIYAKVGKKESSEDGEEFLAKIGFLVFIAPFVVLIFTGRNFVTPSSFSTCNTDFWQWLEAPTSSPLSICRTLLTVYTLFLATYPRKEKTSGQPE